MEYKLFDAEYRFMDIIWELEPVNSTQLCRVCQQRLGWKKPTTYTVLRRLCQKGIFQNEGGVVTARISREEFDQLTEEPLAQEPEPPPPEEPAVSMLEINVSCPNVKEGAIAFGQKADALFDITREVKRHARQPVIMKLSPNVTDIAGIAKACPDAGADGISLINTLLGMRIDLKSRRPLLANGTGGFSGSAILPVALRMVYQVYEAVDIPVIGMGGVSSAEDVVEMMLAGATAVEVGAANLVDPFACKEIIDQLPQVMVKYGITNLKEIIGGAHHG